MDTPVQHEDTHAEGSVDMDAIMQQVAELNSVQNFTREDSLRSFGQLLRQGKIRKLSRGQFTLSQSSRYTPEQRRA